MKKFLIPLCLLMIIVTANACSNKEQQDIAKFDNQYTKVKQKDKELRQEIDNIHLKNLDQLSKTDTTDKNSKEFKALQQKINQQLMSKFKQYDKAVEQLSGKTAKTRSLKKDYLTIFRSKKQDIDQLKSFVDLCNQSIKYNEDILDYTKQFENNRYKVESEINKASDKGEANTLTSKIEKNNEALKKVASKKLKDVDDNKAKEVIKDDIIPLIDKQIADINQTNISDKNVNNARKNAIEMYYSLQNYYNTRFETIKVSNKLSEIDVDKLPKEGKDIIKDDKVFEKRLEKVKEQ
ncbi:EMYY motif lipoprotein [Staphylococcus simiae]|uniref:EMYY motif lipoprotein n=1 Tax=Staphylococcus simiae TaxID=308354 RepID=UPI000B949546|nr:EMYY motif lipoprotein [Staphylococcus simiae]PNZ10763.1 EMYY motif lipoprotein [Staphylococcus simiae]SNV64578.1 Uncharacterised protein [Staphylococcus simiae]